MPPRPRPDDLLQTFESEAPRQRGHLKIFLGAAPGVGKTYAMLQAAHAKRAEGRTILVGILETHGRKDTQDCLGDLELLPRRALSYQGKTLSEFDLDEALKRRPSLLLVDELAHQNVPGSRHHKRYQDVLEILQAGIDVYTTLNVQHLESLRDTLFQITGVRIRETLPDSFLQEADEIELIDLPPEELIQRMREGKIYAPEQAQKALQHFFVRGNLLALREIALRQVAEKVDDDLAAYRRDHSVSTIWPAASRLLVCVGPSPFSQSVIRTASRIASRLRASWSALYVELPLHAALSQTAREQLLSNLRLAEQLGAQTYILPDEDIASAILTFARRQNATMIVTGKPLHARWKDRLFGSFLDDLIRDSGEIEVHLVKGEGLPASPTSSSTPASFSTPSSLKPLSPWNGSSGSKKNAPRNSKSKPKGCVLPSSVRFRTIFGLPLQHSLVCRAFFPSLRPTSKTKRNRISLRLSTKKRANLRTSSKIFWR